MFGLLIVSYPCKSIIHMLNPIHIYSTHDPLKADLHLQLPIQTKGIVIWHVSNNWFSICKKCTQASCSIQQPTHASIKLKLRNIQLHSPTIKAFAAQNTLLLEEMLFIRQMENYDFYFQPFPCHCNIPIKLLLVGWSKQRNGKCSATFILYEQLKDGRFSILVLVFQNKSYVALNQTS